jgi:hypothetical protein
LLAFLGEESAERNIVCTSFRVEAINTRENLKKNGSIVASSDKVVQVEVKVKIEEEEDVIEHRCRMLGCTCSVLSNAKTGKYEDTGEDKALRTTVKDSIGR